LKHIAAFRRKRNDSTTIHDIISKKKYERKERTERIKEGRQSMKTESVQINRQKRDAGT
jgi:hypothetical protein